MDVQQDDTLQLVAERAGNKLKVTAQRGATVIHMDTLDPASANRRRGFTKALCAKVPALQADDIDAQLLRLADTTSTANPTVAGPAELDLSRIIRPEQFYTPDVAGLTVPVVSDMGGKPAARWMTYLRWSDGRHECRPLDRCLELPDGARLWVHPIPGEPSMTSPSAWSAGARRDWLSGAQAPDPAAVFKAVCERIAYYIDLPPELAAGTTATLALWVVLTYCYQAWGAVPYLYVGGPMGSGKSRLFEILARLVFRALVSSNMTGPALFRTLHDRGGTLLYDEAERLRQASPDQQELVSMLLAGYKRGGQATRLEPVGDSFRPVAFDVYGPKALACIAGLPPALASRCIPVMMFRAGPDSPKPRRRIDADPAEWWRLRDDLHALALEYGATWPDLAGRTDVCPAGIDGRSYELWQPLLALAGWVQENGADGLLPLMQQHAQATVETAKDDQVPDADEVLLEVMTEFVKCGSQPTPGEILARARDRDASTFDKWIAATVSRRLKTYGIATPKKSHGERRYKDVTSQAMLRIQKHYGIDLGITDPHPETSTPIDPRATHSEAVK
jgi:hypothetical protein